MADNNPDRSPEEIPDPDKEARMLLNPPNDSSASSNNGQVVLPINNGASSGVGMTKKELMKYANDPFWVRLRTFLFILFWVVWVAMLVGAVLIIWLAPGCPATASLPWWKKCALVQVSVKVDKNFSLKEKLVQATSEVNSLKSSLDTLKEAHLDGLIVSGLEPFLLANLGNETGVETDQFRDALAGLVSAIHDDEVKGKIIFDLMLSETPISHYWFNESKKNGSKYSDYYIWEKERNNSNGSMWWNYDPVTKLAYWTGRNNESAWLNYGDQQLKDEMQALVLSWVRTKLDGIQVQGDFWVRDSQNQIYRSSNILLEAHGWIKKGGQNKALVISNSELTAGLVKQGEDAASFELAPESGLWNNITKAGNLQEALKRVFLDYVQLDTEVRERENSTETKDGAKVDVGAGWRSFLVKYPANSNNPIAEKEGLSIGEGVLAAFFMLPKSTPIIQIDGLDSAVERLAHVKANKFLSQLAKLRRDQSESFLLGTTQLPHVVGSSGSDVFAVSRVYKEKNTYLLLINFSSVSQTLEVKGTFPDASLNTAQIVLTDSGTSGAIGQKVNLQEIKMQPKQVLLIEFAPKE